MERRFYAELVWVYSTHEISVIAEIWYNLYNYERTKNTAIHILRYQGLWDVVKVQSEG